MPAAEAYIGYSCKFTKPDWVIITLEADKRF
jgi:hypothetical protein